MAQKSKLQTLGRVDYVGNVSQEQQGMLPETKVKYHIPWRALRKQRSISTPCRIVFDSFQIKSTRYSLIDIIAKGRNNMNKLAEI